MARISISIESIEKTFNLTCEQRDELENNVKGSHHSIGSSSEYYDTPSGKYFRSKVDEYAEQNLLFLNNDLKNSFEILSEIVRLYKEEIEVEKILIKSLTDGGEQSE